MPMIFSTAKTNYMDKLLNNPATYAIACIIILCLMAVWNKFMRPGNECVRLKYVFINNLKIKSTGKMTTVMNPGQQFVGEVAFQNRRGEPAEVDSGSINYSLKDGDGNDVPPEIATITKNPENEKQFIVDSTAGFTGPRTVFDVHVKADGDLDENEERIVEGNIMGVVVEQLEATTVAAASVVVEPHDV